MELFLVYIFTEFSISHIWNEAWPTRAYPCNNPTRAIQFCSQNWLIDPCKFFGTPCDFSFQIYISDCFLLFGGFDKLAKMEMELYLELANKVGGISEGSEKWNGALFGTCKFLHKSSSCGLCVMVLLGFSIQVPSFGLFGSGYMKLWLCNIME